jgi:hypothetical protein
MRVFGRPVARVEVYALLLVPLGEVRPAFVALDSCIVAGMARGIRESTTTGSVEIKRTGAWRRDNRRSSEPLARAHI